MIGIARFQTSEKEENEMNFFMMNREELENYIQNDPDFPIALNYRLLLALPIIETKTAGGILLSDDTHDVALHGNNIGRIMSIGGTVGGSNGSYRDCKGLQRGDYVHYNPHAGLPLEYNGSRFISLADESILSKLHTPIKHTDRIFQKYKVRGIK